MVDIGLRLAVVVGVSSVIGAAVLAYGHHRYEEGRHDVQLAWDADKAGRQSAVIERQAQVINENAAMDRKAAEVDHETQNRLALVAADRNRAVSAAAGLRDELDRVRADAMSEAATRAGLAAEVATLADVFSECSARRREVSAVADELSVQVTGLLELLPN